MIGLKEIIVTIAGSILLVAALAAWYAYEPSPAELRESDEAFDGPRAPEDESVRANETLDMEKPIATFTTNRGDIEIELFGKDMPITVSNFVDLANDGFYDNTKFHRVIEGFMIQGGDPNSRDDDTSQYGTGGPGYTIQDEFVTGDHLRNVRGTIAMANTGQPNSGGSQFFINVSDNNPLDFDRDPQASRHPVFGRVIAGMDIVDAIEQVETNDRDVPVEPVIIESITVREGEQ